MLLLLADIAVVIVAVLVGVFAVDADLAVVPDIAVLGVVPLFAVDADLACGLFVSLSLHASKTHSEALASYPSMPVQKWQHRANQVLSLLHQWLFASASSFL